MLVSLCLRDDHVVVSVLSTASARSIASLAKLAPSRVVRALPLPAVGERRGVTPLWPATHTPVVRLFERLGGVIAAADERELLTLATTTCVVGQLYAQMGTVQSWLVERGIASEQARRYVSAVYAGALSSAEGAAARAMADGAPGSESAAAADVFGALAAEQTAGGINEQLLGNLRAASAFEALSAGLDAVHIRLQAGLGEGGASSR